MALNGTFYGTTTNSKIKPKIVWSAVQSVTGNYSDITATLSYSRTNTGYTTEGKWSGSLSIGSDTANVKSKYLEITYNSDTEAITHKARVYHDANGELSVTISATGKMDSSSNSLQGTTISQKVTLDTIPRATTIAASRADIESALLIHLDVKNSSFTYSLEYSFGKLRGYIDVDGNACTNEVKLTNSTPWFNLPATFYSQIPNDPSGQGTLYCRTYSGNTQIGETQSTPFTADASSAKCKPDVTGSAYDINPKTVELTGDPLILINGHSLVRCEIAGIPKNGASLSSATVNKTDVVLDENASGHEDITVASGQISFRVEDSRGFYDTYESQHAFIDYSELTCRVSARRVDPVSGKAELTVEGMCFAGTFTAVKNTITLQYSVDGGEYASVEIEPSGINYSITLQLEGLDYQSGHKIEVIASDKLTVLKRSASISKSIPVFDWGENDFQFHVPVNGTFFGTFQGAYIRTVRLWDGEKDIHIQSKWTDWDAESGAGARQSLFLFGFDNSALICGVIGLRHSGAAQWEGSGDVNVTSGSSGQFAITLPYGAYDYFTLISAEPFEIL